MSGEFRSLHETGSRAALLLILSLSFLYGVLHAAGPGHGKAVVASYFIANKAHWTSSIVMGGLISLVQGISAIAIVGVLGLVLRWAQFEILDQTTVIEFVSYGLIALIGVVMLWRALRHSGHFHHHHAHDAGNAHGHGALACRKLDVRLVLVAGSVPCASAIIMMLFALANDVITVGIVAVLVMSLGMGMTVSALGILAIAARDLASRLFGGGAGGARLERVLTVLGARMIVTVAGLLMIGAWVQL
jgi:ABC-type nickel/cobalt efflux system permease component RcnA